MLCMCIYIYIYICMLIHTYVCTYRLRDVRHLPLLARQKTCNMYVYVIRYATLRYGLSGHVMSCHVMSRHVTSHKAIVI